MECGPLPPLPAVSSRETLGPAASLLFRASAEQAWRERHDGPASPGASAPRRGRLERALRWTYVATSTVDAYQTTHAPAHVAEANPLLTSWAGDRPSEAEMVLFRTAATVGVLELTDRFARTRRTRRTVLVLINLVQLAAVVHNERVSGGIVF